jgi:hypothetical protein
MTPTLAPLRLHAKLAGGVGATAGRGDGEAIPDPIGDGALTDTAGSLPPAIGETRVGRRSLLP